MTPLVSILIPVFNKERYVADAIRSAISQTWPNKEVIVVDDGSSDNSLEIARRFACENVTVIRQDNSGAAAARNAALSVSQGDFIQYLDADDRLAPDKIEKQLADFSSDSGSEILLSSAWAYFLHRTDRADFRPSALWCDLTPVEWLLRKMEHNLFMQPATWLVSRKLSDAAGPWDVSLTLDDDGEYFCRVLLASKGTHFTSTAKIYYRIPTFGGLSIVGQTDQKLESQFTSMQRHIGYLRSLEHSDRVRKACVQFLQNWFISFYPERPDLVAEARNMAAELGGELKVPHLPWKYAWIQKLFGWTAAKRVQRAYNQTKSLGMAALENASTLLFPPQLVRDQAS